MGEDPFDATNQGYEFDQDLAGASSGNDIEGQFVVKLLDISPAVSKAGNDMWVWEFAVVSGQGGDDRHVGRQLTSRTALTDAALWKVEEHGVALGLCEPGGRLTFKRADAIGRMCLADVYMQEGEQGGRKFPSVGTLYPHPSGAGYKGAAARPAPAPAKAPLTKKPTPPPADRAALGGPPRGQAAAGPRRTPTGSTPPARKPEPEPEPDEDLDLENAGADDEIPF